MKNLTIRENDKIILALKKLKKNGKKCLVVLDRKNILLGTLSDGDLRKKILSTGDIKGNIRNIYNKKPYFIFNKDLKNKKKILNIIIKKKFDLVPLVEEANKKFIKAYFYENFLENNSKSRTKKVDTPVIIMAGGKGTRLKPFTDILPKPLIPINEKPFIVHIIENFSEFGLKKFFITINYKSKIIKAFFDEAKYKFKIKFFEEKKPLGTAGSLFYFKKIIKTDFILTNCDIFLKVDLEKIYNFHKINNYDATIVASTKEYTIPYGTCELDNSGKLKKLNEKPKHNYLINTGLYFIKKKFLNLVPNNQFFHLTDLIKLAKSKKYKIGVYPVDDSTWSDVGEWNNFYKTKNTFYNK